MKYTVLVSHGEFADGLASALKMLAGEREDILSCGLKNGAGADDFGKAFAKVLAPVKEDDSIILLADLIGGSPLTTAANVINEKGLSGRTVMIGGMNLPLALTTVLMKDSLPDEQLADAVLAEAKAGMHTFEIAAASDEEDDI